MLKDMEGNIITISQPDNYHIKVIGRSGCGKTYWCCRQIEENSKNVPTLIIDFSGSYTKDELRRNGFAEGGFRMVDMKEKGIVLTVSKEHVVDILTDSLIVLLNVRSIHQKRILCEACEKTFRYKGFFSFGNLYKNIMILQETAEDADIEKNADVLLSRLYHFKDVEVLRILTGSNMGMIRNHIIELSNLPSRLRIDFAQFILEVLWRDIQENHVGRIQLVLDEFQLLRLKGTAIEAMLREGRKFGLGLILLTQYVKPENTACLEQAASSLYFLPNEHNFQVVAQMLDPSEYKKWIPKLKGLKCGQCVLDAAFAVNGKGAVYGQPILCNVEKIGKFV